MVIVKCHFPVRDRMEGYSTLTWGSLASIGTRLTINVQFVDTIKYINVILNGGSDEAPWQDARSTGHEMKG